MKVIQGAGHSSLCATTVTYWGPGTLRAEKGNLLYIHSGTIIDSGLHCGTWAVTHRGDVWHPGPFQKWILLILPLYPQIGCDYSHKLRLGGAWPQRIWMFIIHQDVIGIHQPSNPHLLLLCSLPPWNVRLMIAPFFFSRTVFSKMLAQWTALDDKYNVSL